MTETTQANEAAGGQSQLTAELDEQILKRLLETAEDERTLLRNTLCAIYNKLEYGDIYQWDDGDECWNAMRELCA